MEIRSPRRSGGPRLGLNGTAAAVVDVWRFGLEGGLRVSPDRVLSRGELQQARTITSALARRRFLAGRVRLRQILSRYCGVPPSRLPIQHTEFGKPYLEAPFTGVSFNLSHSRGTAILAVSDGVAIGVDLEERRSIAAETIAACWLHEGEREDLLRCSKGQRQSAFFRLWCRKEAVLKGQGSGLRFPLHEFRVSVAQGRAEVLSWPLAGTSWHLYDLTMDGAYTAALALDRPAKSIRYREPG